MKMVIIFKVNLKMVKPMALEYMYKMILLITVNLKITFNTDKVINPVKTINSLENILMDRKFKEN